MTGAKGVKKRMNPLLRACCMENHAYGMMRSYQESEMQENKEPVTKADKLLPRISFFRQAEEMQKRRSR